MKYIDAEALKKEIAKAPVWTALTITEKIENAPSIDIVRCKECKWADKCSQNVAILETYDMYEKLDFCSHGERKESE